MAGSLEIKSANTGLPDVLQPGLKVVFCGTAVGARSARFGEYYAGPGNQFWPVLHKVGLTPRQLAPAEFPSLPQYGLGLTDLAKNISGADDTLSGRHFDISGLEAKIRTHKPKALAFNGKRAAQEFFGSPEVNYGLHAQTIGDTVVFVLPSTSGAARGFWDATYWRELAGYIQESG